MSGGTGKKQEDGGEVPDLPSSFDYVIFTIPDIHGMPRGRMIHKHQIQQTLDKGFGLYQGMGNFGLNMEIPIQLEEYNQSYLANGLYKPIPSTASRLAWCSTPSRAVGHTLCNLLYPDGTPDTGCTRYAAEQQVKRLEKMGLKILSAFECEFKVFYKDSLEPLGNTRGFANFDLVDKNLDFFLDMLDLLREAGLPIEFFNPEYDEGQYEITMKPSLGLKTADAVFLFRYAVRAICARRGYVATFMTRPVYPQQSNGFHLNHSIWSNDGKDVFHDSKDPQKLSDFARHWIAGLLHHAPALTALLCPTVNCYQRLFSGLAPGVAYWNLEDRTCPFRAKTSQSGAYLENRIPSSACNPYLALAATIAAGLDGVEKKLPCPPAGPPAEVKSIWDNSRQSDVSVPKLPKSLDEALSALASDTVLKEAIGSKLIDYFITLKKDFEIKHFENNLTENMSLAEKIEIQRKYYMPFL